MFVNQPVSLQTGFTVGEMIGSTPALWGGQMPDHFYRMLWHTIKNEKRTFIGTVINKKKNGETYDARLRISPVINTEGEVEFFVGIETII